MLGPHIAASQALPLAQCQFGLVIFFCHYLPMPQEHDVPVCREDLTFAVKMALHKAANLWPRRRRPGDHHRLELVAETVVEHL